jgi:hypothetical protein
MSKSIIRYNELLVDYILFQKNLTNSKPGTRPPKYQIGWAAQQGCWGENIKYKEINYDTNSIK